jgi:signal transduction histidine kinase
MATTIAHEISQPLIAIQNYAQAARRRFQSGIVDQPKLTELPDKIGEQAERAGTITRRVRSLVNSDEIQLSFVPVSKLVEEILPMLQSESHVSVRVEYHPAYELPAVLVDPLQIQLVLVNLLNNAVRSTSERNATDGIVTIDATLQDDGTVQISITDEGIGVSPDRAPYIFDFLYSESQGRMGLGLAICRDIIHAHGGNIWHEVNPAGGAIFRFTLRTKSE